MPSFTITGLETSGQTLTGFNSGFIASTGTLLRASGTAITATNSGSENGQLTVLGAVATTGNGAAATGMLEFDGADFHVFVGSTGSMTSVGTSGIGVDFAFDDEASLTNHGDIYADGLGVVATHADNTSVFNLVNTGTIGSQGDAINLGNVLDEANINNSGLVTGGTDALEVTGSAASDVQILNTGEMNGHDYGISMTSMLGDLEIVNGGLIYGGENGIRSLTSDSGASRSLSNSGTVQGDVDAYVASDGTDNVFNSGLIRGNISTGNESDTLENTNLISGSVDMGDDADTVKNTGAINGDITLGDGADNFRGNGGTTTGTVFGGGGDDTFYTDQADVVIDGGGDFDTLIARGDVLDTVSVELIRLRGSDNIAAQGDLIDNEINGNIGDNVINGGDGEDTIRGGAGDDELIGSGGKDILIGGQGADVFVYNNTADSTVADADRVRNFTSGDDIIDLSSSSFNGLVFIDAAGFAGTGGSELRVTTTGSTLRVEADTDGDGNTDLRIVVTGEASLAADDFLL